MKKIILCLIGFSFTLNSCIKDTFDTPTPTTPGGGGGGGGTATSATIAEIRSMYAGNGVKVSGRFIEGVVVSDKDTKNINGNNVVIQDASGGIVVRFSTSNTFALGDKVKVTFTGDSLTKFSGLMQIYVAPTSAAKTGTGTITPETVTISAINANISQYESELVKIDNATITSTGTFSGSKTLNDGNTITLYTTSSATFATSTLPSGPKSVTGIVGLFNSTKQLSIRNLNDIQ